MKCSFSFCRELVYILGFLFGLDSYTSPLKPRRLDVQRYRQFRMIYIKLVSPQTFSNSFIDMNTWEAWQIKKLYTEKPDSSKSRRLEAFEVECWKIVKIITHLCYIYIYSIWQTTLSRVTYRRSLQSAAGIMYQNTGHHPTSWTYTNHSYH